MLPTRKTGGSLSTLSLRLSTFKLQAPSSGHVWSKVKAQVTSMERKMSEKDQED